MMKQYLQDNLVKSFCVSPFRAPLSTWALVPVYFGFAAVVGFSFDLLKFEVLTSSIVFLLPFTLFVFPSIFEEAIFRGILIPRNTGDRGIGYQLAAVGLSTLVFVLWHPLNATLFNHAAIPVFYDPAFLIIVTALGITCGFSYIKSKSIWVPVIIHWVTVLIWVIFLGGRNLVLEI